jgi:hypothetical protein
MTTSDLFDSAEAAADASTRVSGNYDASCDESGGVAD